MRPARVSRNPPSLARSLQAAAAAALAAPASPRPSGFLRVIPLYTARLGPPRALTSLRLPDSAQGPGAPRTHLQVTCLVLMAAGPRAGVALNSPSRQRHGPARPRPARAVASLLRAPPPCVRHLEGAGRKLNRRHN